MAVRVYVFKLSVVVHVISGRMTVCATCCNYPYLARHCDTTLSWFIDKGYIGRDDINKTLYQRPKSRLFADDSVITATFKRPGLVPLQGRLKCFVKIGIVSLGKAFYSNYKPNSSVNEFPVKG